jgi:hypothetical protein
MKASSRKLLVRISMWLLISALTAMFDPLPIFIHQQEFDRAAVAFEQNPTPENETVLRNEQRENQSIRNEVRVFEAAGLFLAGIACYGVYAAVRLNA